MKVLIIVDIQNDFLPGGVLAVPQGNAIIGLVNALQPRFDYVLATQDWHPADHCSFAAVHPGRHPGDVIELEGIKQTLQPVHCVQGTRGAAFAESLDTRKIAEVFRKGLDRTVDSYSGFYDSGKQHSTGMERHLKKKGAKELYIVGLATDQCVKYTALDAASAGFRTHVITDACRGFEREPGDIERALAEMKRAGVKLLQSTAFL